MTKSTFSGGRTAPPGSKRPSMSACVGPVTSPTLFINRGPQPVEVFEARASARLHLRRPGARARSRARLSQATRSPKKPACWRWPSEIKGVVPELPVQLIPAGEPFRAPTT
jgi:hypothetical protein